MVSSGVRTTRADSRSAVWSGTGPPVGTARRWPSGPIPTIFGEGAAFRAGRLYRMARSKAYLFGGVEIRWRCAAERLEPETPAEALLHFPGGLADFLRESLGAAETVTPEPFAGRVERNGKGGAVEWAVAWTAAGFGEADGFLRSYCNTIPTPAGGTHEAGLRAALTRGLKAHAELIGEKRGGLVTSEDVIAQAGAMISVFIRDPEFQGQTKERLSSSEAQRLVEQALRDPFDHWLAAEPKAASALLGFVIGRAEERLKRRKDKEIARATATRKLRLPGKLADCSVQAAEGTELFIVEGDSAGGSAKQARDRRTQAILPLRGRSSTSFRRPSTSRAATGNSPTSCSLWASTPAPVSASRICATSG